MSGRVPSAALVNIGVGGGRGIRHAKEQTYPLSTLVDGPVLGELKISLLLYATRRQQHKTLQHWSGAGGEPPRRNLKLSLVQG